jgi:hypothetical protein
VKEVLHQFIIPGANALYAAEADAPAKPEASAALEAGANKLVEGAQLLRTGPRLDAPRPGVEDNACKALVAVQKKDLDAMTIADGDFTAQCEDCHKPYRDAGAGMMNHPDR